jgi:hypothetical protein
MRKNLHKSRLNCRCRSYAEVLEPRCLLSAAAQIAAGPLNTLNLQIGSQVNSNNPAIAPDGSLWYVRGDSLQRLSIDGTISTFAVPPMSDGTPRPVISDLTFTPDDSAWFVVSAGGSNRLEKLGADGSVSDVTTVAGGPIADVMASNGSVFVTNDSSTWSISAANGGVTSFNATVATPTTAATSETVNLLYMGGGVMVNATVSSPDPGQMSVSADYINSLVGSSAYQAAASAQSTAASSNIGNGTGGQNGAGGPRDSAPLPLVVPMAAEAAPVEKLPTATHVVEAGVQAPEAQGVQAESVEEAQAAVPVATPATIAQPKESVTPTDTGATGGAALAQDDDPGVFQGEFCIAKGSAVPAFQAIPSDLNPDIYSSAASGERGAAPATPQELTSDLAIGQTPRHDEAAEEKARIAGQNGASCQGSAAATTVPAALADGSGASRLHAYTRWWNMAVCVGVATGLQLWNGGKGRRLFLWANRRYAK